MLKKDGTVDSTQTPPKQLARRRGDYGFDAPYVPIIFAVIGSICLILGVLLIMSFQSPEKGVAERVELQTADMRQLPFEDSSFEVVLSSLAIHNIPNVKGRLQAIDEAARRDEDDTAYDCPLL